MWLLDTLAQTSETFPSAAPWAGWAGFLTSGGVLIWLLFWHLPAKDKQLSERDDKVREQMEKKDALVKLLVDGCDAQLFKIAEEFKVTMRETREEFRETLKTVIAQTDRHVTSLAEAMRREFEKIRGGERG